MRFQNRRNRLRVGALCIGLLLTELFFRPSSALAESVNITVPASVTFAITNINATTNGSPNPTRISFSSASLTSGHRLQIQVKVDTTIPVNSFTWTTTGAVGGTASNGSANATTYTTIFTSNPNPSTGRFDVTWKANLSGTGVSAGTYSVTLRWRVASI